MLFDFTTLPPADRYKLLVSTIVPRPIAWVVTQDRAGRVNAAPYSFFNAFCQEPPIVCLGIGSRDDGESKDTGRNIRESGEFVVNLVPAALSESMNVTAIEFPAGVGEIDEAKLETLPSLKIKPPRIKESPVAMECVTYQIVELGAERMLVLGQVLAMHVRDEAVIDAAKCYIDTPRLDLIGRMHGRGWYTRTRDRFEMPRIRVEDWEKAAPLPAETKPHGG
jgi:flavin reductase (DIM6/NTAB) family NADH-FMN oxidoreductase RutF